LLRAYGAYAKWRERPDPDAAASIAEFIARRLHPDDFKAMEHRYGLVAREDVRPIAAQCTLPVFHLAGLVDPIVPAPQVRHWLKHRCPGFQAGRVLCRADHNVLSTAPEASADLICAWMRQARA
jgi:pimeloyl-ACP methyl ester carboxylesterase